MTWGTLAVKNIVAGSKKSTVKMRKCKFVELFHKSFAGFHRKAVREAVRRLSAFLLLSESMYEAIILIAVR